MAKPKISCVTTLYKSERYVEEFMRRMDAAVSQLTDDYELIIVDDGSPDRSLEVALSLASNYPCRIVELSRNFGHHPAIVAGLAEAQGDFIFLIDSDLEEAPELIGEFWKFIDGYDVVFGVHDRTGKNSLDKISGSMFWSIIDAASSVHIEKNLANVRLMNRSYVNALLSMPDTNIFLGGMYSWPGFKQLPISIERTERKETSYSIAARFNLALVAAISFSTRPLYAIFATGSLITFISFIFASAIIIRKIIDPASVLIGYTSLIVSIWLLGGILMGSIGLVGFYIAHIYDQSRNRPRYIVRNIYGNQL